MSKAGFLDGDAVRLRYVDFGGSGTPAILLHGLCGTADEWSETASWLSTRARVIAFDQRGHGKSTRRPNALQQSAFVSDATCILESMGLRGAIVIGQSMGGRTAQLLAAHRPDLVRALVLVEATPAKTPSSVENLCGLLEKWPRSFRSRDEAERFFAGPGLVTAAWVRSLDEHDGKLYPQFDSDVMLDIVQDSASEDYWKEWSAIRIPSLIVAGSNGLVTSSESNKMLACNSNATFEKIAGAGHDVHLERPAEWKRIVSNFLDAHVSSG